MEEANLPEEMIVLILTFLPVKSLIQFTCVSKRFNSIILSDPKFAQSQLRAARDRKTLTQRLLCSSSFQRTDLGFGFLDLGVALSVRKLELPFRPASGVALPLGSCNDIAFLTLDKVFHMWNPSIGFFKILPHPVLSTNRMDVFVYGVGYLPATNDYKVFMVFFDCHDETLCDGAIYSSRSHAWTTVEVPFDVFSVSGEGILLKEALHWLLNPDDWRDEQNTILAFDLAQEEDHMFRTMLLPRDSNDDGGGDNLLGASDGGCLSVVRYLSSFPDRIGVWVMREYDVRDSWTKLYNLKFSDPPKERWCFTNFFFLEAGIVACISTWPHGVSETGLVKILQKEEENCSIYMPEIDCFNMIHYEESLLRIED